MLPSSDKIKILLSDAVGSEERRDRYKARRHRRKRKELIEEDGYGQPTDKYIESLANHALEESRLLGYDHDLLVLPPRHYQEVSTDYTAAGKLKKLLVGDGVPKLSRDESDEEVVIASSRVVESPVLINSSSLGLSLDK